MVTFDDWVVKAIHQTAKSVHPMHENYCDIDDLRQEGYVLVLENLTLVEEQTPSTERYLRGALFNHMLDYARQQRYLKDGTRPDDYFRYTSRIVEAVLPDVLDGDVSMPSPSDIDGKTRGGGSASTGFEREVVMADVAIAFGQLKDKDRSILLEKFGGGDVDDEVIAVKDGITVSAVRKRIDRSLIRLAKHCNGDYSPPQKKKVRTNASSQVLTRRQEEGQ